MSALRYAQLRHRSNRCSACFCDDDDVLPPKADRCTSSSTRRRSHVESIEPKARSLRRSEVESTTKYERCERARKDSLERIPLRHVRATGSGDGVVGFAESFRAIGWNPTGFLPDWRRTGYSSQPRPEPTRTCKKFASP